MPIITSTELSWYVPSILQWTAHDRRVLTITYRSLNHVNTLLPHSFDTFKHVNFTFFKRLFAQVMSSYKRSRSTTTSAIKWNTFLLYTTFNTVIEMNIFYLLITGFQNMLYYKHVHHVCLSCDTKAQQINGSSSRRCFIYAICEDRY